MSRDRIPDREVVVIGAGFGGIGAAIELNRAGIDDYVILDKQAGVGGCWLVNRYPGVAVDVPVSVYSFSYEQRSNWSRLFAPGAELQRYATDVATKHGLWPRMRFEVEITGLRFDADRDLWHVSTRSAEGESELTARWLISATGPLERPAMPDIEGVDDFDGRVMHTARWDVDYDHRRKRVAVIGTGASALQVIPAIAADVESLTVYQRTPIWVAPRVDPELGALGRLLLGNPLTRPALRAAGTATIDIVGHSFLDQRLRPLAAGIETVLRRWMRSQVDDPVTADALVPDYGFGCKRPSMHNGYLKTFNRPNVELVTSPIERFGTTGIVDADGTERPADLVVCATGFKLMRPGDALPFPIHGLRDQELGAVWDEHGFASYQGVSVPDFPNLFSIAGPYGFVYGSYFWMLESTSAHAARVIAHARRRGTTRAEVRRAAHDDFVAECKRRQLDSPLFGETCAGSNTYYVNAQGDSPIRPSYYPEMWWANRHFPIDNYRFRTLPGADRHLEVA